MKKRCATETGKKLQTSKPLQAKPMETAKQALQNA